MQRVISIGAAFLAIGLAAGCHSHFIGETEPSAIVLGSGRFVTESRPVNGIAAIAASGAIRVHAAFTGSESLEITAEHNLLPLLDSVVVGDRLTLGWKPGVASVQSHGIDVRVGVRTLRGIDASGACVVDVDGLAGGDFRVALSGASQFTGHGAVDRLDADLSGASRMTAPTLTAGIATVRLSGASAVLLRVVQSLTGSVDGASTLDYLGDPSVQVSTSGASVVRRAGP